MADRPILFSGPLVRAIIDGRKTVTRRLAGLNEVNADPDAWKYVGFTIDSTVRRLVDRHHMRPVSRTTAADSWLRCPYGLAGDTLWVRETWAAHWMYDDVPPRERKSRHPDDNYWYRADPDGTEGSWGCPAQGRGKWCPSIHMPRWASRLSLRVVSVRPERLQAITPDEIRCEGLLPHVECTSEAAADRDLVERWILLWDSINPAQPGASNPWVWRVEFKRVASEGAGGV